MTCLVPCLTAGDICEYANSVSETNMALPWRHEHHTEQAQVLRDLGPGCQAYLDSQDIVYFKSLLAFGLCAIISKVSFTTTGSRVSRSTVRHQSSQNSSINLMESRMHLQCTSRQSHLQC